MNQRSCSLIQHIQGRSSSSVTHLRIHMIPILGVLITSIDTREITMMLVYIL